MPKKQYILRKRLFKNNSSNMEKQSTPSRFQIGFSIVANISSSILIIMLNKMLFTSYKFPNMTLTCFHFIMTALGLKICLFLKIFEAKEIPLRRIVPLSLAFCGFVVFTNLSLQYNTVGTYQLIKVLTCPCIMIIHYTFYRKLYTIGIILTLVRFTFCFHY